MKQNINKKQWDELDKKEQIRILKTLGYSDISIETKYDCDKHIPKGSEIEEGIKSDIEYIKYGHLSNINIGTMIEFLGDDINIIRGKDEVDTKWTVEAVIGKGGDYDGIELADALWEAVKHKLK